MAPRITRINPDQLHTPPGYHHITVIDVQIDQVVSNSAIALAAVGAQLGQVVRSVVYVVSTTPQCWPPPGVG